MFKYFSGKHTLNFHHEDSALLTPEKIFSIGSLVSVCFHRELMAMGGVGVGCGLSIRDKRNCAFNR